LGAAPTLVGFLTSWKIFFKGWKCETPSQKSDSRLKDAGRLAWQLSPILAALVAGLVFKINFILALLIGVVWVEIINKMPPEEGETPASRLKRRAVHFFAAILRPSLKWQLIIIPVGINFFRTALTSTGTAKYLAALLLSLNLPLEALFFIIPLLISISTGLHLASVTISVPLLLPMLGGQDPVQPMFLLLVVASVGYWMSPLHLCMILTQEYMKASYAGTVRIMFWPSLMVAVTAVAVYILLR
jgi:hypothetical protein